MSIYREELICCPMSELVNLPPPRRDWHPLNGSGDQVELAEAIRIEKLRTWKLPPDIFVALKRITDADWWIHNRLAEDPASIAWPKSWWRKPLTVADFTPDEASKIFRTLLRNLIASVRQEYRLRHWRCERCREGYPRQVWLVRPIWSALCTEVEEVLGQDNLIKLVISSEWTEGIKDELIKFYKSQAQHIALCRSCSWEFQSERAKNHLNTTAKNL